MVSATPRSRVRACGPTPRLRPAPDALALRRTRRREPYQVTGRSPLRSSAGGDPPACRAKRGARSSGGPPVLPLPEHFRGFGSSGTKTRPKPDHQGSLYVLGRLPFKLKKPAAADSPDRFRCGKRFAFSSRRPRVWEACGPEGRAQAPVSCGKAGGARGKARCSSWAFHGGDLAFHRKSSMLSMPEHLDRDGSKC